MLFLVRKKTCFMAGIRSMSSVKSYEDAIRALNTLQSNAEYLRAKTSNYSMANNSIHDMKKYLLRTGITLQEIDKLSVIHVAGTKGKGSTCAFVEAILRSYGFRTGFYSSPHLIRVTERIRINGQPVSEEEFAKQFWIVYDSLYSQRQSNSDMPTYFNLLTVLMFHVFLNAGVNVAIIEVGIGGEHDPTNIVRNPVCVGITSLGYDHTKLLGSTIESIAYQKSGIFKEHSIAFTVQQPENAMNVMKERAIEKKCTLNIVPESYNWNGSPPVLGIAAEVQQSNASLAIQLSHTWMQRMAKETRIHDSKSTREENNSEKTITYKVGPDGENDTIRNDLDATPIYSSLKKNDEHLSRLNNSVKIHHSDENKNNDYSTGSEFPIISMKNTALALSHCVWPGRTQVLRGRNIDFYIDGAHTVESIELCASWYLSKVRDRGGNCHLIFNATGDRDPVKLLKPLKCLNFNNAYFVPNISGDTITLDQTSVAAPIRNQIEKCWRNHSTWGNGAIVLNSVGEALQHIQQENEAVSNVKLHELTRPQVLITGSLHLVGAALTLLDPNLTMRTSY